MKILIKLPSRSRKPDLLATLESIWSNVADVDNTRVLMALDLDDTVYNNPETIVELEAYPNTTIAWGYSDSKIHAVNRDMPKDGWDVVCVFSDDFRATFWGFDQIIRHAFEDGNYDKLIHLPDGQVKRELATMYIAGRTFYERFNYIYNPVYLSLFCDNEIMQIAQQLGKYEYIDIPGVILHLNPAYGGHRDDLFNEQQTVGWTVDLQTYNERKIRNFDIHLLDL